MKPGIRIASTKSRHRRGLQRRYPSPARRWHRTNGLRL